MDRKILIATTNSAKKKRLEWVFSGGEYAPVYLNEIEKQIEVEETADTFVGNASLKAEAYSKLVPYLVLASDAGVVIPVLGNRWNALHSKRFIGENATDRQRVEALIEMMKEYKGDERIVYFQEAVAVARGGHTLFTCEARGGERMLLDSYDPDNFIEGWWVVNLLYYPEYGRRFTELTQDELDTMPSTHWILIKNAVQKFLKDTPLEV